MSQRYAQHIASYSGYKNYGRRNCTTSVLVFDAYGIENCSIELIENYPCESRQALDKRELCFINSIPCVNYRKNSKDHPLSINCIYCPLFSCKLKSDYSRHILTVSHLANEKLIKQHETTKQQETIKQPKFKWIWSEDYKVQRMVRVHEEYSHRSVPSIHKYNFHNALVDIADRFSPSLDKSISHLNADYFHSSFY